MPSTPRNAFVALCNWAAGENWCWKMHCTTCGHMLFRYSLRDVAKGLHPDSTGWRVSGNRVDLAHGRQPADLGELPPLSGWPEDDQVRLNEILANVAPGDIAATCRFPDWLGYLGLALHYCENIEAKTRRVTRTWVPQLVPMMVDDAREGLLLRETLASQSDALT